MSDNIIKSKFFNLCEARKNLEKNLEQHLEKNFYEEFKKAENDFVLKKREVENIWDSYKKLNKILDKDKDIEKNIIKILVDFIQKTEDLKKFEKHFSDFSKKMKEKIKNNPLLLKKAKEFYFLTNDFCEIPDENLQKNFDSPKEIKEEILAHAHFFFEKN